MKKYQKENTKHDICDVTKSIEDDGDFHAATARALLVIAYMMACDRGVFDEFDGDDE